MAVSLEIIVEGNVIGRVDNLKPGASISLRVPEAPQETPAPESAGPAPSDACPCGSELPFATCAPTHMAGDEPEPAPKPKDPRRAKPKRASRKGR